MCNLATCGHSADCDVPKRTVYPGRSAADNDWVLVTRASDFDWDAMSPSSATPDIVFRPSANTPTIGHPKRNKVRTRMQKLSRKRNRA